MNTNRILLVTFGRIGVEKQSIHLDGYHRINIIPEFRELHSDFAFHSAYLLPRNRDGNSLPDSHPGGYSGSFSSCRNRRQFTK